MTRGETVGSGLNQLDDILREISSTPVPPEKPAPSRSGGRLRLPLFEAALALPGLSIGLSIVLGVAPARWTALLFCLLIMAVLAVGVDSVPALYRDARRLTGSSWRRGAIPLTDDRVGIHVINRVCNSAQVREKTLKIVQYVLKLSAYSALLPTPVSAHLKALSKLCSIARRFFKFFRWVKHFEDIAEAREQTSRVMSALLFLRIAANFGADWAEDVCSLERAAVLPAGSLSVGFLLFAEQCQLVLALVEVGVTSVRVRKEADIAELAGISGECLAPNLLKQRRKLAMVRLELVKYVSDVGKAIYDCELPFSHEGLFICCALFSALVSTHKNIVKVLK